MTSTGVTYAFCYQTVRHGPRRSSHGRFLIFRKASLRTIPAMAAVSRLTNRPIAVV